MEVLYTCEVYERRPKDVALTFARTYWAHPRKLRRWKENTQTFEVVGGAGRIQVYAVRLVQRPRESDIYAVVALSL